MPHTRAVILSLALGTAACGPGAGIVVANGTDQQKPAGSAAPTIPAAALKAAAGSGPTAALYAATGWHALWNDGDAKALSDAIANRAANGLDRVDFGDPDAGGDAAARDVARTLVALRYASALAHGATDPASLHDVYTLPRPHTDVAASLGKALAAHRVSDLFAQLVPQDPDYRRLSEAYLSDRKAAAGAPAPSVAQGDSSIHPGDNDPRVADIAQQLASDGYLDQASVPAAGSGQVAYSGAVVDAVKRLQVDYGIKPDGVIGANTLAVVNTGPADKAAALAVALERRRWLSRTPPATRIDVNTAAATLTYWRDGKVVDRRRAVVGQPGRETPPLQAPLYRLVANPTWTVPKSIDVSAATIRADNMHRENGYLVQPSGPKNALGLVKFDMKDDQQIYLHDTSDHSLFDRVQRDLSHGCVRVQDALGFAQMLVQQQNVTGEWSKARQSGKESYVSLPQPIPVRLLYWNAFVDPNGQVALRTDPYGWNDPIAKALGFRPNPATKAKAQNIDIGP